MSRIAILGCGPAGLLVAHAAARADIDFNIYSIPDRSSIPGSQHLQSSIPGITSQYPEQAVQFVRVGTAEAYAEKVYGDPCHPCGWEAYNGVYASWSVFSAYDLLWDLYGYQVKSMTVMPGDIPHMIDSYERVISTIPAKYTCRIPRHSFNSIPYWIKTLPTPIIDSHREVVVFNGLPHDWWYRWSILGGVCSIEATCVLDGPNVSQGVKALDNDCDCFPAVIRLGRWAKWRHGVLLHHAYQEAEELFRRMR